MSQGPQRFSSSAIWAGSQRFYEEAGVHAWTRHALPTRICNNAALAQAYASVVHHFLADCDADPGRPVHVVELGAGTGAFAHLFLCAADQLAHALGGGPARLRYVLTDVVDSSVDFWRIHPRLRAHAAAGRLDRARFDVLADQPVQLLDSGASLSADGTADPVVVIANYVLDSLPCDVFRVRDGVLEEGRTTATPADLDPTASNQIAPVTFAYAPVTRSPCDDPVLDRICAGYAERLDGAAFTMPVGGVRCLRRLATLTSGPVLVIAADKGYVSEEELAPIRQTAVVQHEGAISMSVNFDALSRAIEADAGVALHTTGRGANLQVAAFAMRAPRLDQTRAAFVEALDRRGPLDTFSLLERVAELELSIDDAIALLRATGADPVTLAMIGDRLRPLLDRATPAHKRCLAPLLERALVLDFPWPGAPDVALQVGVLLAAIERPAEALAAFAESIALRRPSVGAWFGTAMCQMMRDQQAEALAALDRALALDPDFAPARQWRDQLAAQTQRSR